MRFFITTSRTVEFLIQIQDIEKQIAEKVSTFDKALEPLMITSTQLKNFKSKASYNCVSLCLVINCDSVFYICID